MISIDLINGIFEGLGGAFIMFSVVRLYRDKIVRGVSWAHVSFFFAWGLWNLIYYPALDQWISFWGGVGVVATNAIWLAMMIYYLWKEKHG